MHSFNLKPSDVPATTWTIALDCDIEEANKRINSLKKDLCKLV